MNKKFSYITILHLMILFSCSNFSNKNDQRMSLDALGSKYLFLS